ncbi:hypothetical protein [Thiohalocapsa sp. ML1]|jgi:hypothetical protein|uniref:hypothetical protein n=1 Tax=Thiohalocapsa sp. ML1 TaxID=1431688 RepID=UPI0007320383|nr:hypothetical protein [Thiohalocapsa sp. ML1]
MPKILSANRANVLVDGEPVEGLQEIAYKSQTPYADVAAIGARNRIGVVFGTTSVTGSLRIRSLSERLDALLTSQAPFQIFVSVNDAGDEVLSELSFNECYLHGKSHVMGAGNVAETLYEFSATAVAG